VDRLIVKTVEYGVLKTHMHCTKILCILRIWFLSAVSRKQIVGPLFFEEIGGAGNKFGIYCNYTLFMTFLVSLKDKNQINCLQSWVAFYTLNPMYIYNILHEEVKSVFVVRPGSVFN
jgi:hypothetical protein